MVLWCKKKKIKTQDIDVENIFISNKIETKNISKYLFIYLDQIVLVLIFLKMRRYVKIFKEKNKKLMRELNFCIEDKMLLEKYKTIWTKIEDLKNNEYSVNI